MWNSTCNIDIRLQPPVDCQGTSYATAVTGPKRKAVWNNDLKQTGRVFSIISLSSSSVSSYYRCRYICLRLSKSIAAFTQAWLKLPLSYLPIKPLPIMRTCVH